jgi:2-aminoethylphosphonate transport system permease protein
MDWQPDHVPLLLLDALATLARTGTNTALYALGAGVIATALGFVLALAVGRSSRLRAISLAAALILLAFPPAASALGVAVSATAAPAWLDPLLRSRLSVCIVLGLRLFPLSAVFALRALATTPPSWAHAAALHGVPASTYLRRVTWPAVRWSAFLSVILVALLASADVGTVLLLHPPGESSFPLAIFTVMANAPESTVAALCLTYLAIAGSLLWAAFASARGER